MSNQTALHKQLKVANHNAKKKDMTVNVDFKRVEEEEKKANEKGYGLYKIKDKSTIPFTQVINENMLVLAKNKYLTNAEQTLMFQIMGFCEHGTNAIINPATKTFITISEIAEILGRDLSTTSKTIASLLTKGMIYEFVNAQEIKEHGRTIKQRPLFLNPEIIFSGDKNKINGTLCRLCMEFDRLEKNKLKLEWKLWIEYGNQTGKLLRRKTYIAKKKGRK